MRQIKRITALIISVIMLCCFASCGNSRTEQSATVEKNGDIVILFTSDVHCGVDKGFGYAGLWQIRSNLEEQGYTTVLVDDGDSIQGETIGTLTKGEAMIDLMNSMKYDIAIPGNHEFDFGADRFLELTEKADFPYISCNITKEGEPVFEPYIIKEVQGKKIAFVGVTTPETLTSSAASNFQNEAGETVYGFMQDSSGESVYSTVQNAVDSARSEGADYVYVMGHMGMNSEAHPWTYADVIEHTNGIDVFLDGHSHDTEQVVMKNKDGEDVVRSACGTKLNCIGYSIISKDEGITETDVWSWTNDESAAELMGINNDISKEIEAAKAKLEDELKQKIGQTAAELTINDPEEKDNTGNFVRMVRRAETNLGDFCADAILQQTGADIAVVNGGGIRTNIPKGEITYGNIIDVFPFGNQICIVEVSGQQILDALEWGVSALPEENGAFLQVAGMSYEVDVTVPSPCKANDEKMCSGIEGERRVKNVKIAGEPLEPDKTYTLAGADFTILSNGDGFTAFDGANVIQEEFKLDNQVLIDYIEETLGGEIGSDYADPYGQGRIVITD